MKKTLTSEQLYYLLTKHFPKQNDYYACDYEEERLELQFFGIDTPEALEELIEKHKASVMKIDREPLDEQHLRWYREDGSIENLEDKIKNEYWFAYPALLRITLELEFGDRYKDFANELI